MERMQTLDQTCCRNLRRMELISLPLSDDSRLLQNRNPLPEDRGLESSRSLGSPKPPTCSTSEAQDASSQQNERGRLRSSRARYVEDRHHALTITRACR